METILFIICFIAVFYICEFVWDYFARKINKYKLALPEIVREEKRARITKPWGSEDIWAHNSKYVGKILHLNPNSSLSRQYHVEKDETIMVITGELFIELQANKKETPVTMILTAGDACHIEPGMIHMMFTQTAPATVVEVSTCELHDVVRLSDRYGRV